MGKQRGIVHLAGRFDDTLMVIDGNRGGAHLSSFVDKDRVAKDPSFDLVRKNMSEFKGASLAASAVMKCLGSNSRTFSDRYFRSRLMGKTRKVVLQGAGMNGQRGFEVIPNKHHFAKVELNKGEPFGGRFMLDLLPTVNTDRNTVVVDLPDFLPQEVVQAPLYAEQFRLCLRAGVISDISFNTASGMYEPVNPTLAGLRDAVFSAMLPVSGALIPSFQMMAQIPGLPVLPTTAGLVVGIGIEFFKVVNTVPELFAQGNAMCILEVY